MYNYTTFSSGRSRVGDSVGTGFISGSGSENSSCDGIFQLLGVLYDPLPPEKPLPSANPLPLANPLPPVVWVTWRRRAVRTSWEVETFLAPKTQGSHFFNHPSTWSLTNCRRKLLLRHLLCLPCHRHDVYSCMDTMFLHHNFAQASYSQLDIWYFNMHTREITGTTSILISESREAINKP